MPHPSRLGPRPAVAAGFDSAHSTSPQHPGGQARHLSQLPGHPSAPPGAQAPCLSPPHHPGRLGSCSSKVTPGQMGSLPPTWRAARQTSLCEWCKAPMGQGQIVGSLAAPPDSAGSWVHTPRADGSPSSSLQSCSLASGAFVPHPGPGWPFSLAWSPVGARPDPPYGFLGSSVRAPEVTLISNTVHTATRRH